ncbi:MAG TPA: NAD(P)-dependent oxidoreductase [Thermoanaerobaculia bacterium]|jgi:UDP-glucose 4-epimerase
MGALLVLGAGQVGTFAAWAAAELGVRVVAADLCPAAAFYARFGPRGGGDLLQLDALDPAALRSVIETYTVDRVVLATGLSGMAGTADPHALWKVTVDGARATGQAAVETGVRRLVFLSSFAVYGRPAMERISETAPVQPRSAYGRAKATAEEVLLRRSDDGLSVCILRPCGLYGPHRPGTGSRSAELMDRLLAHCLSGDRLSLQGPPGGLDEYLYVKDLGHAVALAALADSGREDAVLNVGTGRMTTLPDLRRALLCAVPSARVTLQERGDQGGTRVPLQIDRIRAVLGFQPRYDLAAGLCDYLRDVEGCAA